jgi:hypothetical protein
MPKTCPQCQSEAADDAATCSNCGAALGASSTATQAAPAVAQPATAAAAPATAATGGSSIPAYKFDAGRWSLADRIAGVASLVLLISLFLSWFSASVGFVSASESGVSAHGYLYIVMILCILILAYMVLRAGWDQLPISQNIPHVTVMMVATIVNLVLVFIAFIFKPSTGGFNINVGWSFGAFLALIAAIVAAAPYAIPQLRARTM